MQNFWYYIIIACYWFKVSSAKKKNIWLTKIKLGSHKFSCNQNMVTDVFPWSLGMKLDLKSYGLQPDEVFSFLNTSSKVGWGGGGRG